MRQVTLRVINNFGLDFKQFISKEDVLRKIVTIVKSDEYSQSEQRDAIMTLKSLACEAAETHLAELEKIVTSEFLIEVLESKPGLRDQALIMIKQHLSKVYA